MLCGCLLVFVSGISSFAFGCVVGVVVDVVFCVVVYFDAFRS